MNDLIFPIENDNVAGIGQFFYIPVKDIASMSGGLVEIKEGTRWFTGKVRKYSLEFEQQKKETRQGVIYQPKLSGYISKVTSALSLALTKMDGHFFVVIYKDKNGFINLIGTKEEGLLFEYNLVTGNAPGNGSSGADFTFSGKITTPAVAFVGDLPGTTPTPPTIIGEPVTIMVGPSVVATVPAGGTFLINSKFTLEFQIL